MRQRNRWRVLYNIVNFQTIPTINGLTFDGVAYLSGGYRKIVNLVVINIRFSSLGASGSINGFPTYTAPSAYTVPCLVNGIGNNKGPNNYCGLITSSGAIGIYNLESNKIYALNATYICN